MSESAAIDAQAQDPFPLEPEREPEPVPVSLPELADLAPAAVAEELRERLFQFLRPLLLLLDALIDVRLVRTLLALCEAIVCLRHREYGLLLSELGGYLLSPEHAPAGTKRLSNLLRCDKWAAALISDWLFTQALQRLNELEAAGKRALLLWDESVIEKPESRALERFGLCPVRSAKANRLARSRPGPAGKPTFVNGLHWLSLLLVGMGGPPTVAAMSWFTTRGEGATGLREAQAKLWRERAWRLGRRVLHVFDRGYASHPWLRSLLMENARILVRWPKRMKLLKFGETIEETIEEGIENGIEGIPAWQVLRGKKTWDERVCFDAKNQKWRKLGILAALVSLPDAPATPLWLVCARPGDGKEPWLLLTNEPANTVEEAWQLVLAYARRWQIEMSFRYNKSELAIQSPRLWTAERREKLLMIVTLCYAFLLSLVASELLTLRLWLLRHFCHRTGKRGRETATPLYRLRSALSRLWMTHPEPTGLYIVNQSSG